MFGSIGLPEMIVIGLIALIIFGPRKLPEIGKSIGKTLAEFKRATNDVRSTIEDEIRAEEQQNAKRMTPPAPSPPIEPVEPSPPRVDVGV